ncbi:MAG TPA: hypothetical protein VJN64_03200 [Terriglobales bacterium]|nr:hypothetical protein [Terriglobales bacterium]
MTAEQQKRDYLLLTLLSAAISVTALIFYLRHNELLLYGDAVAHINIARRVFDSRTPGIFQLGTVWLPLPHLMEIPFIVNDWMWRTGVGAAIPSMLAYIAGALGIFRLVRPGASRASAWIAALIYVLNPNLIYLQSTAMTEPLYLAFFIWTVVHFADFVRLRGEDPLKARGSLGYSSLPKTFSPGLKPTNLRRLYAALKGRSTTTLLHSSSGSALLKCALVLSAAMLTRYDAWFLAAVLAIAITAMLTSSRLNPASTRIGLLQFALVTGATAALWFGYNYAVYGNALEFANGPYSARAIEHRTRSAAMATYPGENSPRDATLYFLKVARLNMGQGRAEYLLPVTAFVALIAMLYFSHRRWPWLLLWAPLPFYAASIAWGSVPLYFPDWYPFSYYNVRYGLQLLPAFAVFAALGCEFLRNFFRLRWVLATAFLLIFLSYFSEWRSTPICLREARVNGAARMKFEQQLASALEKLPPSATLLMNCGAHSGAVQAAGVHFSRIIRETNFREWQQALTQPARSADYLIAFPDDEVWRAAQRNQTELDLLERIGSSGSNEAFLYRSLRK